MLIIARELKSTIDELAVWIQTFIYAIYTYFLVDMLENTLIPL